MKLDEFDAVCFDAFGTLVEITDRRNASGKVLRSFPLREIRKIKQRLLCENRKATGWLKEFQDVYGELGLKDALIDLEAEAASVRMRPGMSSVWFQLKEQGKSLGICSNLSASFGQVVLDVVPTKADVVVFSYVLGFAKPDQEIYRSVIEQFGLPARRILFVGDTPRADYDGPKQAGMAAIYIDEFKMLFQG